MPTNQTPFTPKFGLEVPLPSKFNADVVIKDKVSLSISTPLTVAGTVNLTTANGNTVPMNGSGTIVSFGTTETPGESFELVFNNVALITNGPELLCPQSDLTVYAGDRVFVVAESATVWRVTGGFRADGSPLFDNSIVYAIALG